MRPAWAKRRKDMTLSSICPPSFGIQLQPQSNRCGGGITVAYWKTIFLTRWPVQQRPSLRVPPWGAAEWPWQGGIPGVHHPSCYPTGSLLETADLILNVMLESSDCWCWGTSAFMLRPYRIGHLTTSWPPWQTWSCHTIWPHVHIRPVILFWTGWSEHGRDRDCSFVMDRSLPGGF